MNDYINKDIEFSINLGTGIHAATDVEEVIVNGEVISNSFYVIDGNILKLKNDYLSTLPKGEYIVGVIFNDSENTEYLDSLYFLIPDFPKVEFQTKEFDLNNPQDVIIEDIYFGKASFINYIMINGYKTDPYGNMETSSGLENLGIIPYYIDLKGNLVITVEYLKSINLNNGLYAVTVFFDDFTIIDEEVSLYVINKDFEPEVPDFPTIDYQVINYYKSNSKDAIIKNIHFGRATSIDYIKIGNYKIEASGKITLYETIMDLGETAYYINSDNNLVIKKELFIFLNFAEFYNNFINVCFDDGTLITYTIHFIVRNIEFPTIDFQMKEFDLNNPQDIIIQEINFGNATAIDYIRILNVKTNSYGNMIIDSSLSVDLGETAYYIDSNNNLVITKEFLNYFNFLKNDSFSIDIYFDIDVITMNAITVEVIDTSFEPEPIILPTIESQTKEFDLNNPQDVIIEGVFFGSSLSIIYIKIGDYKINSFGDIDLDGTITSLGTNAYQITSGNLIIKKELLTFLNFEKDYTFFIDICFDDDTLIKDTILLHIVDNSYDPIIEPEDPENPIEPSNPDVPVDPVEPTNPTEPSTPENPVEPTKPTEPTKPSNPTYPSYPTIPIYPTPVNPVPTLPEDKKENEETKETNPIEEANKILENIEIPEDIQKVKLVKGSRKGFTIEININNSKDIMKNITIYINDKELDRNDYFYNESEGVLIIDKSMIKDLSEGNYVIKIGIKNEETNELISSKEICEINIESNEKLLEIERTVTKGSKFNLSVTNKDKNSKVSYKSSNTKIATIKNGVVTTKKAGTTVITITYTENEITYVYTITLKVTDKQENKSILDTERSVSLDGLIRLNNELENVKFEVKNKKLLSISKKGLITPKKSGTTTIKVTETTDGLQFEYDVKIKVKK